LTPDWRKQLKGAFAFDSAPFASHPNDERRALLAIATAIRSGASKVDIEREICEYFRIKGFGAEFISYQLRLFRSYFSRHYSSIKNCWILSKGQKKPEFVAIFSGRVAIDKILHHSMHIYETREYNHSTQFMRAKKKSWPVLRVRFHEFASGALWQGRISIGDCPTYLLERADANLTKTLDPFSAVSWKPKPLPDDPGETWHGMLYPS
jgi:hypothetical protein